MLRERRNNNYPPMYVILCDLKKKCFPICNFIYSSLHHREEVIIKGVKSSGMELKSCLLLSVVVEMTTCLGFSWIPFPV